MYKDTRAGIIESIRSFLEERGVSDVPVVLEKSTDVSHGDVSTPIAFVVGKKLGQVPFALAEEIVAHLQSENIEGILRIEAVRPGFINITFDEHFYASLIAEIVVCPDAFGKNTSLEGQVWAVEHTSPNPNKAMHLGHLRNNLVGMGAGRLLETCGASVVYEAVDNNRGIAIAKLMAGFLFEMRKKKGDAEASLGALCGYWITHQDEWYTPEELGMLPDIFVSQCYLAGDVACKTPLIDAQVRELVLLWESEDEAVWKVWSHVLAYSYAGMERTLRRLGNRWDVVWHEHEHYKRGKEYVEKGLAQGIFKKLEDGAVLTDLSAYGIPDTILLKRDGTSLYITQDLALTALKKEKHHADHLVWVVGPDQTLALRQLFAVCEQLGIGKVSEFTHVVSGYVGLKGGDGAFQKMSSRAGTVVLIDDVIDTVRDALKEGLAQKGEEALPDASMRAEALALVAVKFSVLKVERTQDVLFDVEHSVALKGDSGIYVMYTYVRTQSILRKARALGRAIEPGPHDASRDVSRALLFFPEVILRAQEDFSLHHVAQYLLELSGVFNRWYAEEIILDGTDTEKYRLAVVTAVGTTIQNALGIMGIQTVDEM